MCPGQSDFTAKVALRERRYKHGCAMKVDRNLSRRTPRHVINGRAACSGAEPRYRIGDGRGMGTEGGHGDGVGFVPLPFLCDVTPVLVRLGGGLGRMNALQRTWVLTSTNGLEYVLLFFAPRTHLSMESVDLASCWVQSGG